MKRARGRTRRRGWWPRRVKTAARDRVAPEPEPAGLRRMPQRLRRRPERARAIRRTWPWAFPSSLVGVRPWPRRLHRASGRRCDAESHGGSGGARGRERPRAARSNPTRRVVPCLIRMVGELGAELAHGHRGRERDGLVLVDGSVVPDEMACEQLDRGATPLALFHLDERYPNFQRCTLRRGLGLMHHENRWRLDSPPRE